MNSGAEVRKTQQKKCGKCLSLKDLNCFSVDKSKAKGRQSYCKVCRNVRYQNNQKDESKKNYARIKHHREIVKTTIREFKEGYPCADCGGYYPYWIMQFDHRQAKDKRFNLSDAVYYHFNEIVEELSKCDLVCANCHAHRTQRRRFEIARSPNHHFNP